MCYGWWVWVKVSWYTTRMFYGWWVWDDKMQTDHQMNLSAQDQQWVKFFWCLYWLGISSEFHFPSLPQISTELKKQRSSIRPRVSSEFYFLSSVDQWVNSGVCTDLGSAVTFIVCFFHESTWAYFFCGVAIHLWSAMIFIFSVFYRSTVSYFFLVYALTWGQQWVLFSLSSTDNSEFIFSLVYALGSALSFIFFLFHRFLHPFWPKCGISTRLRLAEKLETEW